MIKKGSNVKLHFTLTVGNEVVESSRRGEPFSYVHGEGQLMPGLEQQLEGLEPGDKKTTSVAPENAYGRRQPDALRKVQKAAFTDPTALKQGDVVSGQAQGQPFQATVVDVSSEEVTLDVNHPLAGKTLQFEVEILEVG